MNILDDLWKIRHKKQFEFNTYCDSLNLIDGQYQDENGVIHFYVKDKIIKLELNFKYFLGSNTIEELFTSYGKIEFDIINYISPFFKSCIQLAVRTIGLDLIPIIPITSNYNNFVDINCDLVYKYETDFS